MINLGDRREIDLTIEVILNIDNGGEVQILWRSKVVDGAVNEEECICADELMDEEISNGPNVDVKNREPGIYKSTFVVHPFRCTCPIDSPCDCSPEVEFDNLKLLATIEDDGALTVKVR